MTHVYKRGDIVRHGDTWGVVWGYRFAGLPAVHWLTDEDYAGSKWTVKNGHVPNDLGAPFDHEYEGVPEDVLVKATHYKLTENS